MYFYFSDDNSKRIKEYIKRYPVSNSAVYWCLHLAQKQNGFIDDEVIKCVASILSMNVKQVSEVASFYSMFKDKSSKKYVIKVCESTSCWLRGSDTLYDAIRSTITKPKYQDLYDLTKLECLGCCVDAPAMQINEQTYERVSLSNIDNILDKFAEDN